MWYNLKKQIIGRNNMNKLTIHINEKQNELGDLYVIFFEDLNHAEDGGL